MATVRERVVERRGGRTVDDGTGGPVASAGWGLARLITTIGMIVAGILVLTILLVVLNANASNEIVKAVHDAGRWLAGPFRDIFSFKNHKTAIAVNYGLAAVVYLFIASMIARLLSR